MSSLPFRPNVCLLIINRERKIFLGERQGQPGVWQLPQGGVEPDTSDEENALREAHEELGVDISLLRVVRKFEATHEYDYSNPPSYAIGRFRGQRQTFWLLELTGEDCDINLDRFEPELMSDRWVTVDEVEVLAEPKRLKGYEAPLREFREWLKG